MCVNIYIFAGRIIYLLLVANGTELLRNSSTRLGLLYLSSNDDEAMLPGGFIFIFALEDKHVANMFDESKVKLSYFLELKAKLTIVNIFRRHLMKRE